MTVSKSFPWHKLSFVLFVAICGVLAYDVNKHGTFRASSTGRFLKDIGALTYFEQAYTKAQIYSLICFKWCMKNIPTYYQIVKEATAPILVVVKDVALVCLAHVWNVMNVLADYTAEKLPVVVDVINSYAPGLFDTIQSYSAEAWRLCSLYLTQFCQIFSHYFVLALEWAKVNVFVGKLSPENLQKYTMEAINTTHNFATETFAWLNQQTDAIPV